jgi:hypothetical protein
MLHQIEGALGITPDDSAAMQADATGDQTTFQAPIKSPP